MSELRDGLVKAFERFLMRAPLVTAATLADVAEKQLWVALSAACRPVSQEPKVTYHYFMSKSGCQGDDGYRHAPYASVCLPADAVVSEATFGADGRLHLKVHREG